jgi:hypothetical protein
VYSDGRALHTGCLHFLALLPLPRYPQPPHPSRPSTATNSAIIMHSTLVQRQASLILTLARRLFLPLTSFHQFRSCSRLFLFRSRAALNRRNTSACPFISPPHVLALPHFVAFSCAWCDNQRHSLRSNNLSLPTSPSPTWTSRLLPPLPEVMACAC